MAQNGGFLGFDEVTRHVEKSSRDLSAPSYRPWDCCCYNLRSQFINRERYFLSHAVRPGPRLPGPRDGPHTHMFHADFYYLLRTLVLSIKASLLY